MNPIIEREDNRIGILVKGQISFVLKSLETELRLRKVNVEVLQTSINMMSMGEEMPKLIVVNADDYFGNQTGLKHLKEMCETFKKKIVVVGGVGDIELFKATIPARLICMTVYHPISVRQLVPLLIEKLENIYLKKTILVIDDSGMMLRTVMGWLEDEYEVILSSSADDGMKKIAENKPDMILLDYEMPGKSGGEFLKELRADAELKKIPVIFLTAKGDSATVKMLLTLKPDGYLLKTTPSEKVLNTIGDFFARQGGD